jgi:hypothetical protein
MITPALWAVLWIGQAASAVPADSMLPSTTPPIIYTMDYTARCFTDLAWIDRYRAAPPDLLHVAEAVPIVSAWGPVRLYAGSDAGKLNLDDVALLTPEALTRRIAHIRETVARYHALGIKEIVPYICLMTLAGDHQKRLGFWAFYDHWDRYAQWVGPRPANDPFDWTARAADGTYSPERTLGYPYAPPYFAPLHRYNACIHHPDWQRWQQRLIRLIAQAGYDGCFLDNVGMPLHCCCGYCKSHFARFLEEHRDAAWVRRLIAGLMPVELTLDSPKLPADLRYRWETTQLAEYLGTLRRTGRKENPHFTLFANGNEIQSCLAIGTQSDRLMLESTSSPGLRCADNPPSADASCVSHLAEWLFAQHMHARTMSVDYDVLRDGWGNVQELALAEMAAFGGGGGLDGAGSPQALYRSFFRQYPELFAGWQPTAPAAVLYGYWCTKNPLETHRPVTHSRITDVLAAGHRPFVALVDASLPAAADELAGFAVIYLGSPSYEMSSDQLRALGEYAGRIVLVDRDVVINGRPAIELIRGERVTVWDPKRPTTPTPAIAPTDGVRKNVYFAIYRKADRLAVHAVNYNVCLLDPQRKVLEVEPTPLCLPLPAGWKAAGATCFEPGVGPQSVPCRVADGIAQLTLPKLHIYKIVLLDRH